MSTSSRAVLSVFELSAGPWKTFDPFLFCVHHVDKYPVAHGTTLGPDPKSLRGRNIGSDFSYRDGWSMYHGDDVPGFPRHPHRGFETITVTRQGCVDHSDSFGATARYGLGDTQWMTAGKGIQHSEMFPLLNTDGPNTMELFQVWLNLPKSSKMVDPHFTMFWDSQTPVVQPVPGVTVKVVAGDFGSTKPLPPPPESWAASPQSDVGIWLIDLAPGATLTLPPAKSGSNRAVYYYEGAANEPLLVSGTSVSVRHGAKVAAEASDVTLENRSKSQTLRVLLLQGRPIGDPVVQYGPFVMNTQEEITQAFQDYQSTQFGGWRWGDDAPVHDRKKGRFALHPDGRVETAPQ